jgi:hypothetical protein
MIPIKRIEEKESYPTTVGWLKDFTNKVAKEKAPPSPFIMTSSTEKFATIEDKMNDMKSRVGFASIMKVTSKSDSPIVSKSSKKCDCGKSGKKCICNSSGSEKEAIRLKSVKNILDYIRSMMENEKHLLCPEVMDRCRQNQDLQLDSTGVREDKLMEFIEKIIKKTAPGAVAVTYNSPNSNETFDFSGDIADYYKHSTPTVL